VQVNGKVRDTIFLAPDTTETNAIATAKASDKIQKWLDGKQPKKEIYIPAKIINLVI